MWHPARKRDRVQFQDAIQEQVSAQVQQLLDPKVAERNQFAAPCLTARIQVE
ncbi:hypothetical protein MC7420_4775 [Coleofasciculus chthonoplastes PCC 7420]|uniref:Uncharacterized protein n=1 Tax=Coleofasciculus chthonoplastes PCC 7420 TaxID=118168 RepID=B4VNB0_9CYAN|nr:hypothetical protein MC7420_4775 [Coleofasciculus chthonoplastes PCC 7420]